MKMIYYLFCSLSSSFLELASENILSLQEENCDRVLKMYGINNVSPGKDIQNICRK